ncbi:MAG: Fic family protein [Planctomycetaceae bacterium]|nr:Fic family protein [Planctomycetaceae bacterium]
MQRADFQDHTAGRLVKHERGYWAYVPNSLPPDIPLTWELAGEVSAADRGLSELAGIGRTLPNPYLLIQPFMRREAVLSSRIEGTQASLSDLFYFEASQAAPAVGSDVREVRNYVLAMEQGLARLNTLPLSLRLLREIHAQLMDGVAGDHLTPGEFRRSQNWIGPPGCTLNEATYVPSPPEEMMTTLGDLEKFWHAPSPLPFVVRLALIHYQFEAIHPFLDGNGRIGRLLVTLLLCTEKVLPQPMLYLSAYFERHRDEYYRRLLAVSQRGEWVPWLSFFLRGVAEQSRDAVQRAEALLGLWQRYRAQLQTARASALLLRLIDELFRRPYLTISQAADRLDVTFRSASLNVGKLVKAGILEELPGRSYGRIFRAREVIEILEAPNLIS